MSLTRAGILLAMAMAVVYIAVTLQALLAVPEEPLRFLVRLFGLYGYLSLGIAVIMTPFLRDILRVFGAPFLSVHHALAVFGLLFPTLHPVALALRVMNLTVFIPVFDSWTAFWALAGRPAFFLLYIGLAAALLRTRIPQYWRWLHGLMYVVFILVYPHAVLIGTDLETPWIFGLFTALFFGVILTFFIKRIQRLRMQKRQRRPRPEPGTTAPADRQ